MRYTGATWETVEGIINVLRIIDTATVNHEVLGTTRNQLVGELVTLMTATIAKNRGPEELSGAIEVAVGLEPTGKSPTILRSFRIYDRQRLTADRVAARLSVPSNSRQIKNARLKDDKPRCPAIFRISATKNRNKAVMCAGPPMHKPPHVAYPPNMLPVTWLDEESWIPGQGRKPDAAPLVPPTLTVPKTPRQLPAVESNVPSVADLLGSMLAPGAPDRCESTTLDRRGKKPGLDPLPLVCQRAVGHRLPHAYYPTNGSTIEWDDTGAISLDH